MGGGAGGGEGRCTARTSVTSTRANISPFFSAFDTAEPVGAFQPSLDELSSRYRMRGFFPPSTDLKLYLVTTKPGFISRWRKVSRPSFDLVMRVGEGFSTTGSAVTSITGGGMFAAAGAFSTSYAGGGGALLLAGGGSAASTGMGSGASSQAQNMSMSVAISAPSLTAGQGISASTSTEIFPAHPRQVRVR